MTGKDKRLIETVIRQELALLEQEIDKKKSGIDALVSMRTLFLTTPEYAKDYSAILDLTTIRKKGSSYETIRDYLHLRLPPTQGGLGMNSEEAIESLRTQYSGLMCKILEKFHLKRKN